MPNYDYTCNTCNYSFEEFHKMDERNLPENLPCPSCENSTVKIAVSAPAIGDAFRMGITKLDPSFQKDVLGRIKKQHPRGSVERHKVIPREG